MSSHRVTALLVVHDGATWLPEVVASIASQTRSADQILALDTGSQDSSAKLLKGARIPVASLPRESGFGEALTFGVSQLPAPIEGVQELLWILHDDCALAPTALENLLAAIADRPQVVMAGPKLLGWHDRTHLLEVGISIAHNGARWTGLEPHEYDQGQHDGVAEVLSVSTAGALIRRDVFEELGGFDPNLDLFRDDVDFGWRARVAGHSVIAVTSAVGYHAQASATERRTVDVAEAFLQRPLLLDRRNAAYVLLANSPWWKLPALGPLLFAGALIRATAYLFAKLPGYAADEVLAIGTLLTHPSEIFKGRKERKKHRLVSSSVVNEFIPSRFQQIRLSLNRTVETIREKIFPEEDLQAPTLSDLTINEDEDLLVPIRNTSWKSLFTRPLITAYTALTVITLFWARYRFSYISGGALAQAPGHLSDLWKLYVSSWHEIGMGSNRVAPPWILLTGIASIVTLGNVSLFLTLFFLAVPYLSMWTSHRYLKRFTTSPVLSAGAAALYALSPVSISAINAGRLGLSLLIILLPIFVSLIRHWTDIEKLSWRNIYAVMLFLWALFAFNPSVIVIVFIGVIASIYFDYRAAEENYKSPLFIQRASRRGTLLFFPLLLSAPASFSLILHPTSALREIGLAVAGGGPNLAISANPGGAGSLPWWVISPVTLLLVVAYFSPTLAQRYAKFGAAFLLGGTLISSIPIFGNGTTAKSLASAGTFIAIATLMAIIAAVIMFDDIRARLESSHINIAHAAVALILALTTFYTASATIWLTSTGARSPLQHTQPSVLPAFLAVERDAKTLVIRPTTLDGHPSLAYYIARGGDVTLGEADLAPHDSEVISRAVEALIDNTGVGSSKVFSTYGIKYVFLKAPASQTVTQVIDGIGGFARASATDAGIVWKVVDPTGHLRFIDAAGAVKILDFVGGRTYIPGPGIVTITENYSGAWHILQDGHRLSKVRDDNGLPTFTATQAGDAVVLHDGTLRRAWLSLFLIALITAIVMALPSGRRIRDREVQELS